MRPRLWLFGLAVISLSLIHFVDSFTFRFLKSFAPSLSFLAEERIPSLLVTFALYWNTGRQRSFRLSNNSGEWIATAKIAVPWLMVSAYFVLIRKVWVPTLKGPIDVTAFMVTGLLAEEFLFRGAIYQLAERAFPTTTLKNIPVAVFISALFFGLHHLGFHHYQISTAAVTQVIYTTIMGIFFALIRNRSKSIWPSTMTHFLNNCFTLFRNL